MAAPRQKPLNPDAQALLDTLLADPAKATCPICDEQGFYDNRDDPKRPEKAPHFKCKNKDCPGATPLKAKRPYGVWLPDDYVAPPKLVGKRIAPPPTQVPGEGPPAHHREVPLPEEENAPLQGELGALTPVTISTPMRAKMDSYFAVAREVAAFQKELCTLHDMPFDGSSVNAMSFSIFNGR